MNVRATSLSNGIRVITAELPHVESVAVGIWAGAGSRGETAREAGISHFIEHLLFKGTRRRSARQISQTIEGRGGYLNAFTQEESTCYYARVAFDQLPRALDVLSDILSNPSFDPVELEREQHVIAQEIGAAEDAPDDDDPSYTRDSCGPVATLAGLFSVAAQQTDQLALYPHAIGPKNAGFVGRIGRLQRN